MAARIGLGESCYHERELFFMKVLDCPFPRRRRWITLWRAELLAVKAETPARRSCLQLSSPSAPRLLSRAAIQNLGYLANLASATGLAREARVVAGTRL
jgi:hypothetical protein